MSQKKNKKRHSQATIDAKRQAAQNQLADEKDRSRKRMNPTARTLLLGNLVFLALVSWLAQQKVIPENIADLCAIPGVILLLVALWFQFGKKNQGGPGGPTLSR